MTLLEEWQKRRENLQKSDVGPDGTPHAPILRILNFLIHRYEQHPRAQLPARLPLSESLTIRRREILINKYMHYGIFSGVKSREESEERLRKRLAQFNRPRGANLQLPDAERMAALRETVLGDESRAWQALGEALDTSPQLPDEAVAWLCKHFGKGGARAGEAHLLLQRCDHVGIYPWAVQGWTMNMTRKSESPGVKKFAHFVRQEGRSHHTQDQLRHFMATRPLDIRLTAIFHMGRLGKLDDFAMLCDMLGLPEDELSPRERNAVRQSIALWGQADRHPAY